MHERITTVNYNPDIDALTRKKRVAAYARVSGADELSFHSLSAQISYYQKKIAERPDWEFVEVFSDRGITGTKEKREGFQRMLTACRHGEIDIILAKSISRFARNTMILLQTIRELKSLGIDVQFEEERINTLSEKGELMISILAARAQEESRQVSENKKWQYQKAFQKGIPAGKGALGYRIVDKQVIIDENEAKIVQRIFSMYLSGIGIPTIAKTLSKERIPTRYGKFNWDDGMVRYILRNETYIGDLRLQKTVQIDHVSKKRKNNEGEVPMYYVEDDHDSIVSREDFALVQAEVQRRSALAPKRNYRYPFTGLIRCAKCGKYLTRFSSHRKPRWVCRLAHLYGKTACDLTQTFLEEVLIEATCKALEIETLDGVNLKDKIDFIVSNEDHSLIYFMRDGTIKTTQAVWWTDEKRAEARQIWLARKEKENAAH